MFTIICGLVLLVVKSAQINGAKMQSIALTDLALRSAFSEYDTYLFDNYGLLGVNTEYRGESGGDESFINHVGIYIEECLAYEEDIDIYRMTLKRIEITESEYASECEDIFFSEMEEETVNEITSEYNLNTLLISADIKAVFECSDGREIYACSHFSLI